MKKFGEVEMYHAQKFFHVYTVKMYVSLWESFDKDLRNSYFDKFYPMEPSPILQKIADTDEVFLWVCEKGNQTGSAGNAALWTPGWTM